MGLDASKMANKTVVLLIAFLFIMQGCRKEEDQATEHISALEQSIEKFSVTETRNGSPNWILDAESAQILEEEEKIFLKSPKIDFYQEGEYASTLVADKGRINTKDYDIWGEGECVLTTKKGEILETSDLHYKSDIKKIVTEEKVKLVRKDETIYGRGMEATPDLESIIIRDQTVELNDKK
jgi:LPS export ABC transporter protein LptC